MVSRWVLFYIMFEIASKMTSIKQPYSIHKSDIKQAIELDSLVLHCDLIYVGYGVILWLVFLVKVKHYFSYF